MLPKSWARRHATVAWLSSRPQLPPTPPPKRPASRGRAHSGSRRQPGRTGSARHGQGRLHRRGSQGFGPCPLRAQQQCGRPDEENRVTNQEVFSCTGNERGAALAASFANIPVYSPKGHGIGVRV